MIIILLLCSLVPLSCIKDKFDFDKLSDQVEIKPSFVVPVATGSLTLGNAVRETDTLQFDPDNLIRIVLKQDSVMYVSASEFLEIPAQATETKSFTPGPIDIDDFSQSRKIMLDDLFAFMDLALQIFFQANDGTSVPFPPIGPAPLGQYDESLDDQFEYVYFSEGTMDVTLTNKFPVEVSLTAEVQNQSDNSVVGTVTFSNIAVDATNTQSVDLTGRRVDNDIRFVLTNFETPGSGGSNVDINLTDSLFIVVDAYDMKVNRGKALIPDQIIETDAQDINIAVDDNEEIYQIILSSGRIAYQVNSAVSEGLYISLELPNSSKDGLPLSYSLNLDQGPGVISGDFDLSGTVHDLTADPLQPYNKVRVEYEVGISTSGQMIEFDLTAETVDFQYSFEDFDFYYVEAWLGQKTIDVEDEEFDLDDEFFDRITGELRLTNPTVRLVYENSFGVPVQVNFSMTGTNGANVVNLNPPVIDFLAPADTIQPRMVNGVAEINKDNSSIVDLLALPPRLIEFSGNAGANPAGVTTSNFIFNNSYFLADLEIDIPLEMQITDLSFTDTVEVDFGDDLDMLEKGKITLVVDNGFPLEMTLGLILHDSITNTNLHTFDNIMLLEAAPVDATGVVPEGSKTTGESSIELTREILDLIPETNKIIITATVNSSNSGTVPVKILSTYSLDFRIRASASLIVTQ